MLDINEIKKDLYKSKTMAKLLYYDPSKGDLIYMVEVLGQIRTFPIHTTQRTVIEHDSIHKGVRINLGVDSIKLNEDIQGARFLPEIKGSTLIRWIQQAIEANEFD